MFYQLQQQARRDNVNSAEGQRLWVRAWANKFGLVPAPPAAKIAAFVKEQIAGCLTLQHRQGRHRARADMTLKHLRQVDIRKHVNIVQNERLGAVGEEPASLL